MRRPTSGRIGVAAAVGAAVAVCLPRMVLAQAQSNAPPLEGSDAVAVRHIARDGLKLEIAPLTRVQIEAFLVGRGLSRSDAGKAAVRGCFFRSAIANAATQPEAAEVRIVLGDWRVSAGTDQARAPGMREDWDAYWASEKVSGAPAVAFHWAHFPSEQTFAAGDHNWGFLTFMRPPGSTFALDVVWHRGGERHHARLENLTCAP